MNFRKKNDIINLPYWKCMQTYAFVDSKTTYCWNESQFAMKKSSRMQLEGFFLEYYEW